MEELATSICDGCGNSGPGKPHGDFPHLCVYCFSMIQPVFHIEVGKFYDGGYWIRCPESDYYGTGPEKWGVLDNFLEQLFYAENPESMPFADCFDGPIVTYPGPHALESDRWPTELVFHEDEKATEDDYKEGEKVFDFDPTRISRPKWEIQR